MTPDEPDRLLEDAPVPREWIEALSRSSVAEDPDFVMPDGEVLPELERAALRAVRDTLQARVDEALKLHVLSDDSRAPEETYCATCVSPRTGQAEHYPCRTVLALKGMRST